MSGFEQLPGATNAAVAQELIRAEEVAFAGEELTDEAALKTVVQDVQIAEKFIQSKRQPQQWENADNLFRGVVASEPWPGTDVPRSNLSMPVILEAVEKLMPSVFMAFFSDRQPFLIEPRGKTTPAVARAKEKLLMWAVEASGFKEEIRLCMKQWLVYGFTASKWGWKTSTRKKKKYQYEDVAAGETRRVTTVEEPYEISHPTFERVELRNVLFDPSLREQDCRKGKWVCAQIFTTGYGLDDLRGDPTYKNLPTREALATILARKDEPTQDSLSASKIHTNRDLQAQPQHQESSSDPLSQPLELLEWESDDRIITVLQRQIVVRNDVNEFGKKTFLSCAFIDVPGSMYGFGVAKLLSGEQRFQVGVVNKWLDQLSLSLNPAYQLQKGIGPGVQNIKVSPGKIINESGELKPLLKESITTEAMAAISSSEVRANRRVGANSADNMPTGALRTAEGVHTVTQGVVDKLQYSIEIFADLVFIPALEAFLEVCQDKLQPEDIKKILSEQDGKEYQGDILDVYNGTCQISVLSSTKLSARRAAAQVVPLLMQLVSAQPVQDSLITQGKKFNYTELIAEVLDLAGWDCDQLIVDASPEEIKRHMDMQPGAAQAQAMQAVEAQKHADALSEIDATAMGRAGVAVVKHALDESAKPVDSAIPTNVLGG